MKRAYYILLIVSLIIGCNSNQRENRTQIVNEQIDSSFFNDLFIKSQDIQIDSNYLIIKWELNNLKDTLFFRKSTIGDKKIISIELYFDHTPNETGLENNFYFTFFQYLIDGGDYYYILRDELIEYCMLGIWEISNDQSHFNYFGDFRYADLDTIDNNDSILSYSGFIDNDTIKFMISHLDLEKRLNDYPFTQADTSIAFGIRSKISLIDNTLNWGIDSSMILIDRQPHSKKGGIDTNDKARLPVIYGGH